MKLGVEQAHSHRSAVIGRCQDCVFLTSCRGKPAFCGEMWNCFDLHPYHAGDDDVCPSNPDFARRLAEVNGLEFGGLPPIEQQSIQLPLYVPHLSHQYSRHLPLQWPTVAITAYELFRRPDGHYRTVVADSVGLRTFFRLAPQTKVILRGTDVDRPLETYWAYRRIDQAAEQIARLGIDLMIAPNFSHFGDATRTDHLFNRKRQLICLAELHRADVNVAPHLSAAVDADWDFWCSYLAERPAITIVAKEFQTGNKPKEQGLHCLEMMDLIQQRLGRRLHPILIGGAQLVEDAAKRFATFTVLDSRPFQNAMHRHAFRPKGRRQQWVSSQRLPGLGLDDLVHHNLDRYGQWLEMRARSVAGLRFLGDRKSG